MAITASSPSSSSSGVVFITGATGHIGFRTLIHALRDGLTVRVSVRSPAKAASLLQRVSLKIPSLRLDKTPVIEPRQTRGPADRLTFTIIPDMTLEGAFDAALDGVTHIIHVASPLVTGAQRAPISTQTADECFIRPAVRGTTGLLEAADRCGTVRRVVITSSIVALIPVAQMEGTEARPADQPVRATDRVPFTAGPYHSEFAAYANSKMAALAATEAWCEAARPAFDVVHLHPSFVLGRNDMTTTARDCMRGTNAMVLAMMMGRSPGPLAGATVHVDDVARCHVNAAVDVRGVPGGASYILSQASTWGDAGAIARRLFPDAVQRRLLLDTGSIDTTPMPIDVQSAQQALGVRFRGYESQVKSILAQFLELRSERKHHGARAKALASANTRQAVAV